MWTSSFILLFSCATVLYSLRVAITNLLNGPRAVADAIRVAEANRLEFPLVRQALQSSAAASEYGRLAEALRHDYAALTYLLRFAATTNVGRYSTEERLLVADFRMMRALFTVGQWFSPAIARFALGEMTTVLEHFASVMSQRMSGLAVDVLRA